MLEFLLLVTSFNPRICKRCDEQKMTTIPFDLVSIHASVKDATIDFGEFFEKMEVSIHASVKDATRWTNAHLPLLCFNPRICKRCDFVSH